MPRVLLIDDDPLQLRILGRQLSQLGLMDVAAHADARAALQALDEAVQLVCCDLQMPELDGLAVIDALAARGYRGGFLLISGDDAPALAQAEARARAGGLNWLGAVGKPVLPAVLRERLQLIPGLLA